MLATDGLWNSTVTAWLFNSEDFSRIFSMFMQCRDDSNQLLWNYSRYGLYSVKSGYYVAINNLIDSSELQVVGDWNSIWRLHIPHKVKIHLWRAARGILSYLTNLRRSHVDCPADCAL